MANIILDDTMNFADNTAFRNSFASYIGPLVKVTDFTEEEVKCVLLVFYKCLKSRAKKEINTNIFRNLLSAMEIRDSFIRAQILRYLKYDSSKNFLDPAEFVKLMYIFTCKDLETLMDYVFWIYDEDGNGVLSVKTNINQRVQTFFNTRDEEENTQLRIDMTDLLARKFDLDRDGYVSLEEYKKVVTAQPQLLEFLGQCLPSKKKQQDLHMITNMWNKLAKESSIPLDAKDSHTKFFTKKIESKDPRSLSMYTLYRNFAKLPKKDNIVKKSKLKK